MVNARTGNGEQDLSQTMECERAPDPAKADRHGAALAWGLLVLLLVSNGPLFLCMPLTDDAAMFDLQARNALRGGVLYRDIHEPNLPGVVWIHMLVRGTLGPSSVVLRAVDLLFFSCLAALLWNWLRTAGSGRRARAWTVLVLFFCYLSMSEWCHCQRDVWLLVPGLGALTLRRRQIEAWQAGRRPLRHLALWSLIEGLCWGAGVWLKPMIVVPAACCWLVSAVRLRNWRAVLSDLAGLVAGGLLMGGAGIAWLHASGAWPYFVTTLVEWNPRYVQAGREHWTGLRYVAMLYRFFPWQFIHLAAVPVALATLVRAGCRAWNRRKVEQQESGKVEKLKSEKVQQSRNERVQERVSGKVEESKSERVEEPGSSSGDASGLSTFPLFHFSTSLLAVFYLAWLAQSYLMQHLFDYVHAPGVLLAVAVLAGSWFGRAQNRTRWYYGRRIALAGFLVLALMASPVMRSDRLSRWLSCLTQGSTAENRDRLKRLVLPQWRNLERVAQYVGELELREGELTCYDSSLVHLYWLLGWRPSTRYVYLHELSVYFPDRQRLFLDALANSAERYVVSDLTSSGLTGERIERLCPEGPLRASPAFPERLQRVYPWSQPVIFRAGPYLVHRVEGHLGTMSSSSGRPAGDAQKGKP